MTDAEVQRAHLTAARFALHRVEGGELMLSAVNELVRAREEIDRLRRLVLAMQDLAKTAPPADMILDQYARPQALVKWLSDQLLKVGDLEQRGG